MPAKSAAQQKAAGAAVSAKLGDAPQERASRRLEIDGRPHGQDRAGKDGSPARKDKPEQTGD